MKRALIFSAITLAMAGGAHATYCSDGSRIEDHPNNNCATPIQPPVVTPPAATPATVKQRQAQAQGQRQAATANSTATASPIATASLRDSGNGTAQANGNGVNAGAGAGANNANGQTVNLSTGAAPGSGDVDNSRVIVHPSMIPPPPVAINPQGNLLAIQTGCGPQMVVTALPIYATSQGFWGGTEQVPNGSNFRVDPYAEDFTGRPVPFTVVQQPDGSTMFLGTMLLVGMSITNQSLAVSGALGLIRSTGAGGQVGGGVASSLQQMGDRIIAIPCIAAVTPPPKPAIAVVQTERPRPVVRPARRPVVRPSCPQQPIVNKAPSCTS